MAEGPEGSDGGSFTFETPGGAAAAARKPTPHVALAPTAAASSPRPLPPQTPEAADSAVDEAVAVRIDSGSEPVEAGGGAGGGAAASAAHRKRARETGGLGAVLGCVWRRAHGGASE